MLSRARPGRTGSPMRLRGRRTPIRSPSVICCGESRQPRRASRASTCQPQKPAHRSSALPPKISARPWSPPRRPGSCGAHSRRRSRVAPSASSITTTAGPASLDSAVRQLLCGQVAAGKDGGTPGSAVQRAQRRRARGGDHQAGARGQQRPGHGQQHRAAAGLGRAADDEGRHPVGQVGAVARPGRRRRRRPGPTAGGLAAAGSRSGQASRERQPGRQHVDPERPPGARAPRRPGRWPRRRSPAARRPGPARTRPARAARPGSRCRSRPGTPGPGGISSGRSRGRSPTRPKSSRSGSRSTSLSSVSEEIRPASSDRSPVMTRCTPDAGALAQDPGHGRRSGARRRARRASAVKPSQRSSSTTMCGSRGSSGPSAAAARAAR